MNNLKRDQNDKITKFKFSRVKQRLLINIKNDNLTHSEKKLSWLIRNIPAS
jgi:hypothetical protein